MPVLSAELKKQVQEKIKENAEDLSKGYDPKKYTECAALMQNMGSDTWYFDDEEFNLDLVYGLYYLRTHPEDTRMLTGPIVNYTFDYTYKMAGKAVADELDEFFNQMDAYRKELEAGGPAPEEQKPEETAPTSTEIKEEAKEEVKEEVKEEEEAPAQDNGDAEEKDEEELSQNGDDAEEKDEEELSKNGNEKVEDEKIEDQKVEDQKEEGEISQNGYDQMENENGQEVEEDDVQIRPVPRGRRRSDEDADIEDDIEVDNNNNSVEGNQEKEEEEVEPDSREEVDMELFPKDPDFSYLGTSTNLVLLEEEMANNGARFDILGHDRLSYSAMRNCTDLLKYFDQNNKDGNSMISRKDVEKYNEFSENVYNHLRTNYASELNKLRVLSSGTLTGNILFMKEAIERGLIPSDVKVAHNPARLLDVLGVNSTALQEDFEPMKQNPDAPAPKYDAVKENLNTYVNRVETVANMIDVDNQLADEMKISKPLSSFALRKAFPEAEHIIEGSIKITEGNHTPLEYAKQTMEEQKVSLVDKFSKIEDLGQIGQKKQKSYAAAVKDRLGGKALAAYAILRNDREQREQRTFSGFTGIFKRISNWWTKHKEDNALGEMEKHLQENFGYSKAQLDQKYADTKKYLSIHESGIVAERTNATELAKEQLGIQAQNEEPVRNTITSQTELLDNLDKTFGETEETKEDVKENENQELTQTEEKTEEKDAVSVE